MDSGNQYNGVGDRIALYLDNALDAEQKQEFLHQIEKDAALQQAVEREKHFRTMIKNNLNRPKLEPDFIQYIKNKVH